MKGLSKVTNTLLFTAALEVGCTPFANTKPNSSIPIDDSISFYEWEAGRKKAETAAIARADAMAFLGTSNVSIVVPEQVTIPIPLIIDQPHVPSEGKIEVEDEDQDIVILPDQETPALDTQPIVANIQPESIQSSAGVLIPEAKSNLMSADSIKQIVTVTNEQRKALFLKLDPTGMWQAASQLPCMVDINRRLFATPPQYVDGDLKCLEMQQYNCENGVNPPISVDVNKKPKKNKSKSKSKKRLTLEQINEIEDNIEWRGVECALTSNRYQKHFNPNAY